MSEYVEAVIPLYEQWTYWHEFLTREQREGETIGEYFQAKRELLLEGDPCEPCRLPTRLSGAV